MADNLATPEMLALLMQDTGLDTDLATLLLELATGEVQAMARQRIVQVEDDEIDLIVYRGTELELPERPVTTVTSAAIDGVAATDYRWPRGSSRLLRDCGWATRCPPPSIVTVVYSHGYALPVQGSPGLGLELGDPGLVPAQSAVLGLARQAAANKGLVLSESIDDYRVQFANTLAEIVGQSENLRKSLVRTYGTRAGGVAVLA